ncbi:hypothetical protein ACJIZ3_007839 [Penstemon smallii]|uniref:BHLH domain-containing protein n=1 Tax=Penstemon smallii TaxID=265156 RepID=A0ABD3TA10_9LAMI
MNQCVPNWNLDTDPSSSRPNLLAQSNSSNYHMPTDIPSLNYEVAELTWENGKLAVHGLGPPRVINKPIVTSTWDKPRATGTLESIVNPQYPYSVADKKSMDALVPCHRNDDDDDDDEDIIKKENSSSTTSWMRRVNNNAPPRMERISGCSDSATADSDNHDSFCHSRSQEKGGDEEGKRKGIAKSSTSTKRHRAALVHNQTERKRRDKINERMKTLQKLVPNSNKTDKVSMLEEVIEHLKQLQAQIQMMTRMNMSPIMFPLAMQQQLPMSMMGMGVMDMNTINRASQMTGMPPVISPAVAFMPLAPWDYTGGGPTPTTVIPDLLSTFLTCQSQPMASDAHNRLAALYTYQQFQQHNMLAGPSPKN